MSQMMTEGGNEQKEFSDKNYQAMVLQNQKLENKVKDLDQVRRDNHELKASREKQQQEFKTLYEDKQRLYEEIMALKDQVANARGETKEKIMSIQFMEKEKLMQENQIEDLRKQIKKA